MKYVHQHLLEHLLWIIPLFLFLVWLGGRLRARRLSRIIGDAELRRRLTPSVSPSKRRWRLGLLLAAVVLALLAAMRPQWGTQLVEQPARSRDIMVVFDVSRSMLARDLPPSRLQHAKLVVRRIIEGAPGDRFGLVAFAGRPFLECPLTLNRSGFMLFLEDLDTTSIPVGGTNIEAALEVAHDALQAAQGPHRAVLLLTDGDELQGDVERVLERYRKDGIPIFIVGLGDATHGSYIQLADGSFVTDEQGERALTRLNAARMEHLSRSVDGLFVHSTIARDGSEYLIRRIRSLIPEMAEGGPTIRPVERYQIFLLIAVLLLLARVLLGERRRRVDEVHRRPSDALTGPVACVVLALALLGGSQPAVGETDPATAPENIRSAMQALRGIVETQGASAAAAQTERLLSERAPEQLAQQTRQLTPEVRGEFTALLRQDYEALRGELARHGMPDEQALISYGLGSWFQRAELPELATQLYREVLDLPVNMPGVKAAAYQNLGVMHHQQAGARAGDDPTDALKKTAQAEQYYREAMRQPGATEAVARNQERLHVLRRMIEEIIEQQQQQQEGEPGEPDESQQEQQEAADTISEARKQQQQANEADADDQRREAQDQASSTTQQAREQVEKLADKARQAGNNEQAERLQDVADDLREAQEEQQRSNDANRPMDQREEAGRKAEEKLAEAEEKLRPEDGDPTPSESDDDDKSQSQDGQQDDAPPDESPAPPTPPEDADGDGSPEPTTPEEEESFDMQQAERILEAIHENEHNLIKELKRRQMQNAPPQDRRDW